MKIINDWRDLSPAAKGASVAMGNFDGVHLGHAEVIRAARVARPDVPLAVLTFEAHPREVFRPQDPAFRLTLRSERAAALADLGVEILYELPFNKKFAYLTGDQFCSQVLQEGVGAVHLACGGDFAFGCRRSGDVSLLTARASAQGVGLTVVPQMTDAQGVISSTRIRRLLQEGYPDRAAALLGRPHTIRGKVLQGSVHGSILGFPTVNITLGRHLQPAYGIYAITARLPDGTQAKCVANLVQHPIDDGTAAHMEVHLFDHTGDLHGQDLTVALHHFLREGQNLPSFKTLTARRLKTALPLSKTAHF
jgi:riboflavin kinase/FMN adenylyltransferase